MRQYIRHPSDIPIDFQVDENQPPVVHRIKDVSLGGLCFAADKPMAPGTKIHIRIPPAYQRHETGGSVGGQMDADFDADGLVAWCRPEGNSYAVGVQFDDQSTRFGIRMVEQVYHIEHYRSDVLQEEGRVLSSDEAAKEWVERFAAEFPH